MLLRNITELFPTAAEASQEEVNRTGRVISGKYDASTPPLVELCSPCAGSLKAVRDKLLDYGVLLAATATNVDDLDREVRSGGAEGLNGNRRSREAFMVSLAAGGGPFRIACQLGTS